MQTWGSLRQSSSLCCNSSSGIWLRREKKPIYVNLLRTLKWRLVPPHAPVGPLNGCVLPIRWEFPRYTSFQSWRPQKRSFIFLLKSITNLESGGEWVETFRLKAFLFSGCRKHDLFRCVLCSWWHFSNNRRLFWKQKTWELKQTRVLNAAPLPLLPSELTDRRQLQLPCLTALFRGWRKLPSSLFLKLNVWSASQLIKESNVLT